MLKNIIKKTREKKSIISISSDKMFCVFKWPLITIFLLNASCVSNKKKGDPLLNGIIKKDINIKIGNDPNNYADFTYIGKNSNLYLDFYKEKKCTSTNIFRTDGVLRKKLNINFFGEQEVYFFDENNSIYLIKKYLRNKEHNNEYCLHEMIAFNNCAIDKKNSNFIDVQILESKEDKILIEINYVSGHNFFFGEIFYGKQIETSKEAKKLKKMIMKSKSEQFWISKKDILYDNYYIEFSVLIHRDIVSGVYGTKITVPKGRKEVIQFFNIRRLLDSPMRETK